MNVSRLACAALLCLAAQVRADATPAPQLDWLAGHWCGDDRPRVEETWLPAIGGELHGISRTIQQVESGRQRVVAFEFLRIAEHEGTMSYLAQPGGRPPTAFRWTAGGVDWVRFENPQHDFPTRIEYRRRGNTLHAEIAGPDGAGGEHKIGFRFASCERVANPASETPVAK